MKKFWIAGCAVGWAASVLAGVCFENREAYRAASVQPATPKWPSGSSLRRDPSAPSIVIALHSECPCSRASVNELLRVLESSAKRANVFALLYEPDGVRPHDADPFALSSIRSIPGAALVVSRNTAELRAFGARVSGEVWFYNESGLLRFHGGVSSARGHEGHSAGGDAIQALLKNEEPKFQQAPVFGCSLLDSSNSEIAAQP